MNNGHSISDEVLDLADIALSKGKHWIAYNQSLYFIDKEDVYFFDSQKEANDFAKENINDRVSFYVIPLNSIEDKQRQFFRIKKPEIKNWLCLFQSNILEDN